MDPVLTVLSCCIAAAGVFSVLCAVHRLRTAERMRAEHKTVPGRLYAEKEILSGYVRFTRHRLEYEVNGKVYQKQISIRAGKYADGQAVDVVYAAESPGIAYPACEPGFLRPSTLRQMTAVLALMFVFALLCVFLGDRFGDPGCTAAFFALMELLSVCGTVDEHRRLHKDPVTGGHVVYSETDRGCRVVIAEFEAAGCTCETRAMKIPLKKCRSDYPPGTAVNVRCREGCPHTSLIDGDTGEFKIAVCRLITVTVYAVGAAAIWLILR